MLVANEPRINYGQDFLFVFVKWDSPVMDSIIDGIFIAVPKVAKCRAAFVLPLDDVVNKRHCGPRHSGIRIELVHF